MKLKNTSIALILIGILTLFPYSFIKKNESKELIYKDWISIKAQITAYNTTSENTISSPSNTSSKSTTISHLQFSYTINNINRNGISDFIGNLNTVDNSPPKIGAGIWIKYNPVNPEEVVVTTSKPISSKTLLIISLVFIFSGILLLIVRILKSKKTTNQEV